MNIIERCVPLTDIEINRAGDGRTVTAYIATFGHPYPVVDNEGDYDEIINPAAFSRDLGRGFQHVSVVYNHGVTLWGTPSERGMVPIGVPLDIRPDGTGLLTVTRYGRSDLAEEVLQGIKDGLIRGMSFRAPQFSAPTRTRGANGRMVIERTALRLKEYGPTPFPANDRAAVVAVRSTLLAEQIAALTDEQRDAIAQILSTPPVTPQPQATEPVVVTPPAAGTEPGTETEPDHTVETAVRALASKRRRDL